jgi:hypothetical protein
MNWEAINAIAQLVSSLGVVASLVYLAVQVRHNTRVTQLSAQDAATTALREVTMPFAENAELGRIWRVGLENLETLTPDERGRFFHSAFQFLKAMETIHFHYMYGLMEEVIWRGWSNLYAHYLCAPGLEAYFRVRRDLFSEQFQEFVDGLEKPKQRLTVANLLAEVRSTTNAEG